VLLFLLRRLQRVQPLDIETPGFFGTIPVFQELRGSAPSGRVGGRAHQGQCRLVRSVVLLLLLLLLFLGQTANKQKGFEQVFPVWHSLKLAPSFIYLYRPRCITRAKATFLVLLIITSITITITIKTTITTQHQ
jgi:hypothetical protein